MSIVKSLSVGEGDMFYINHNTDSFTIIDCCMPDDLRSQIMRELKGQCLAKNIIRFISTHPDDDHIMGLARLSERMPLRNFYCVKNQAIKDEETEDFQQYCSMRDSESAFHLSKGCTRKWLNESSEERGGSGIRILWPITSNKHFKDALGAANEGSSPNNISPIVNYRVQDGASVLWMGDLEKDFMQNIKHEIKVAGVDILFAPHHGRGSGTVPADWLQVMNPKLIVIGEAPAELLNYYQAYNTLTQNSAGDMTFDCDGNDVHIYASNQDYTVNFLRNRRMPDTGHGYYIGTLQLAE